MHKTYAKKSLGQNFLQDASVARRIVDEVGPQPGETIVEIGPGRGALTEPLLRTGARIVAVELDDHLAAYLADRFGGEPNFALVVSDALETNVAELVRPATNARVVANLPYNISTPILQRLIQQSDCITEMNLMLQREVVERISAGPNDPERGFLSVFVEAHCRPEKLFDVAPESFKPVPKVWSSVVRLTTRSLVPSDVDENDLWRLVGAGFQQRRKTILNNLKASSNAFEPAFDAWSPPDVLIAAGIEPDRRAQTLSLEEWFALCRALPPRGGPAPA